MDLAHLFFNFSGRINRGKYWLAVLVYAALYLMLLVLGYLSGPSTMFWAIDNVIILVVLISSIAVGIKRLHDRNKSAWYMLLFYLAPGVLFAAGMMVGISRDGSTTVASVLWLMGFAIGMWAFVELGCLRGSIGGNSYGPDPLAPEILTPPVRMAH